MKKVLLAGTAIVGLSLMTTPAQADLNLDLGGLFRGYVVNVDDDATANRELDFRRDAEIHFTGQSTLDNGLTVGIHYENKLGDNAALNSSDEVYAYFSGGWGRVNFGSEDGAAYLLQVAAPSADSNIDGLRTYIQGLDGTDNVSFRYSDDTTAVANNALAVFSGVTDGILDYDHADFSGTDRFTYLTPKFSGFQAGVSYAPEEGQNDVANNTAAMASDAGFITFNTLFGGIVTVSDVYEDLWELSARWDGEFEGFGLSFGGGYSTADIENSVLSAGAAPTVADEGNYGLNDDLQTWNVGGNVTFAGFSFGGAYKKTEMGVSAVTGTAGVYSISSGDAEIETIVVGAGWDNGPYHLGVSYLEEETSTPALGTPTGAGSATDFVYFSGEEKTDKITLGGGYTFGPGMTFRGAVAFGDIESTAVAAGAYTTTTNDFTQITIGTDIQF